MLLSRRVEICGRGAIGAREFQRLSIPSRYPRSDTIANIICNSLSEDDKCRSVVGDNLASLAVQKYAFSCANLLLGRGLDPLEVILATFYK